MKNNVIQRILDEKIIVIVRGIALIVHENIVVSDDTLKILVLMLGILVNPKGKAFAAHLHGILDLIPFDDLLLVIFAHTHPPRWRAHTR